MGISSALNNAISGLSASSRTAEVISSNVSNALTEGYAKREISISSDKNGGVSVTGIERLVNDAILKESRLANAGAANSTTISNFYTKIETAIGNSTEAGSLATTISDFNAALISAASSPDSTNRLTAVVDAADSIASKLNSLSSTIQQTRLDADKSIASQVNTLNDNLQKIANLNKAITRLTSNRGDASALMDQRQSLIDQISDIVPLQTMARNGNQLAIYTTGGISLLDGIVSKIEFQGVGVMAADMSLESGALSGLTINGKSVSTADSGAMGGGSLSATFSVRDQLAPAAQTNIDALARNLIERFSESGLDSTLTSGSVGLFTDNGTSLDVSDPENEIGLASRIKINSAVNPQEGGYVWRIRDGIGATMEGEPGNSALINSLESALTKYSSPNSGSYGTTAQEFAGQASQILSMVSSARQSAENIESYATARQEAATTQLLSNGIDTDQELENLLRVKDAYAANAKIIQAIDDMLQNILEL